MYLTFFSSKLIKPAKVLREIKGFLTGKFETKMEMSIFKQIKLRLMYAFPFLFKRLDPNRKSRELEAVKRRQNV